MPWAPLLNNTRPSLTCQGILGTAHHLCTENSFTLTKFFFQTESHHKAFLSNPKLENRNPKEERLQRVKEKVTDLMERREKKEKP